MNEQELRELDAEIAVLVFGWKWWQFRRSEQEWCELFHPLSTWPETHKQYGGKIVSAKPVGLEDDSRPPRYTTDHAAAMEVLERCLDKMNCQDITIRLREDDFYALGNAGMSISGSNFPLAIALFAKNLFEKGPQ